MVSRDFYLNKIENGLNHTPIVILIGARQVGKTTLMKLFSYNGPSLFLNGQDPEISALFQKLSSLETYLRVYLQPELNGLLMIDEFQFIPGVSTMLKLLTDKYDGMKILCSGSSSLEIHQSVEESLAGRVRIIEVFSLSFAEYLQFIDPQLFKLYSELDITTIESPLTAPFTPRLQEYLIYGGFPRAALTHDIGEKLAIIDDIYKTYLIRDVRSYIRNEHFVGFNRLLKMLAAQIGNMFNISELSREAGIPYRATEEYIDLLQQMYIIKLISPISSNKRSAITKMKKIYFSDLGLRNMINSGFQELEYRADKGAIFENFVLLELLRNLKPGGQINYFRTSDGAEVDFVVEQLTERYVIECKFTNLIKPLHIKALNSVSDAENISNRFVINKNLNLLHDKVHYVQGYLTGLVMR